MITFSLKPSEEILAQATVSVLKKKPISLYTPIERIGISEGFTKKVNGKLTESVDIGAFGYAVERNTKMAIMDREVPILSASELERGCKGGVAETFFKTGSFANDDHWLESLDIDFDVITTILELMDEHIFLKKKKSLISVLRLGLKGNPRHITQVSLLVEEFNNFSDLPTMSHGHPQATPLSKSTLLYRVITFMKEYDFKGLIRIILSHEVIAEAMGLYED